jgi:regulator of PEP synthase PpsR (kinase-PPPase family)
VSRTSKTPTCVYLANRGIKAGNIPLVPHTPDLIDLAALTRPLVVGLSINPDSLVQIRRSRQKVMGLDEGASRRYGDDYADLERVREEVVAARRLFARMKWPVIDVTRRSVEETAASIYQMLKSRHDPDLDHLGGS